MPTSQVRPSLRPPDGLGDGGKLLPSRIRQIARGRRSSAARTRWSRLNLARERPPFFGMPSGAFSKLHDDGLEFRDAPSQILAGPRRRGCGSDLVEDIAVGRVERIAAPPRLPRDRRRRDPPPSGGPTTFATHQPRQGRPIATSGRLGLSIAPRRSVTRFRHPGLPAC